MFMLFLQAIPLQFLQIVLDTGTPRTGDLPKSLELPSPLASTPFANMKKSHEANERLTRWHLRLEFFAYETLGNLRISELFDIIVDYPER
jgi:anaphase-promoting complex subunit 2